ncbi:MAG: T9SS type A sorting domain-containing protein [Chitinophagaceae bacterium]
MCRFLPLFLLFLPSFLSAQLTAKPAGTASPVGFYEFLPAGYNPTGTYKYPVIIAMHGAGEKGNGILPQLDLVLSWGLGEWVSRRHATLKFNIGGQEQAFIVLLPQLLPQYPKWRTDDIDAMIDYATNNLNIDVNKIFLTGYSLGGGGAWLYPSASTANANRIAGIFPVAPSPDYVDFDICNIARGNTAVWAFQSIDDDAIPVQVTIDAINGINACSPQLPPLATIYPTGMHTQSWNWSLDTLHDYQYPNIWEWMTGTTRLNTPANNQDPIAEAGNNINVVFPSTNAVLNGSASRDPNDVIVKYAWTKIAGPSNFAIEKPSYPVTNLTNLEIGNYIFQLTVTDQFGIVKTDQVNVNVTTALPVGISYFKGVNNGKANNITWATSSEEHADHFEILRSQDGKNFSNIGVQKAGLKTYSFIDEKAPAGLSYYRLKNIDKDGSFTYSDIITINNNSHVVELSAYPNPVKDRLTIHVQGDFYGPIEIAIHDIQGALVKKLHVAKQQFSWKGFVNVGGMQKGVYTLQVLKEGSRKGSSSFVKE